MEWQTVSEALVRITDTLGSICPNGWTAIFTFLLVLVTALLAYYAREIRTQLRQTNAHTLVSLSIDQNWEQFKQHDRLPNALPSWRNLRSDKDWGWRVLLLNHLNLLELAYQEWERGLMDSENFKGWVRKAKYQFQYLEQGLRLET